MSVVNNFVAMMKPFFDTSSGEKYVQKVISGDRSITINLDEIEAWNPQQSYTIINDALKYGIEAIEKALKLSVYTTNPSIDTSDLEVGFVGDCIPFVKVRDIPSTLIGKLIRIKGLINRTHFKKPWAMSIIFKCRECGGYTTAIYQESPFVMTNPPKKCDKCDERTSYDEVEELSDYIDSQEFSVQETHEDISGRIPQRIGMIIFKSHLINKVYCGDLVEIIGTLRISPLYIRSKRARSGKYYMEVFGISKQSKDPESMEISKEEEQKIIDLSQKPDIYNELISNVAPSLEGMRKCKEACLLSLFGGVTKHRPDITTRGNIHVLFVGDPSTGKSKLLRAVSELSPRGMFSTGRGVTGVGLTAALNKDSNGEWVIDAGVLVLTDKGVACIDEFDKMRNEDRDNIHEAMADQQVSINKAGFQGTLPARASVIAAANPLVGRFDESRSVFENLKKFPPTLFSRFDLIFTLVDKPDKVFDKKVIDRILDSGKESFTIDRGLFKKYIAYAKRVTPTISIEAKKKLKEYFLAIREQMAAEMAEETAPIFYRQFEGLLRLCEARARILLKEKIDVEDAEAVINLVNISLKDINFDVRAKEIGKTKKQGEIYEEIYTIIKDYQKRLDYPDGIPHNKLIELVENKGISKTVANKLIASMLNEGAILKPSGEGFYKTVL